MPLSRLSWVPLVISAMGGRPPNTVALCGPCATQALLLRVEQDAQRLVDPQHRRDPHEDIDVERQVAMLPNRPDPVLIGGPGQGESSHKAALLLSQPPQIGNCQEGPQRGGAEAPPGWPGRSETGPDGPDLGRCRWHSWRWA